MGPDPEAADWRIMPAMLRIGTLCAPWIPGWGWWLVLLAGMLLAVGGHLVALDGTPTCDVPNVTCPRLYSTATAGSLLLGVGGLIGACVAVRYWRSRRRRSLR